MKHNKKRNVGIVYELLLANISNSLLEGEKKKAKTATRIIEKHFSKGTELYKEFRLFDALTQTQASNTHIVASILNEAKIASQKLNEKKLEKEKSALIKDINYKLNDRNFYYRSINNYRELGLVQLTLNEWRNTDKNIKKLVDLETKLGAYLLKEKNNIISESKDDLNHSNRLVLKLMIEKFNKEYSEKLNKDQKNIIEMYVFNQNDPEKISNYFNLKKKETLRLLESFEDKTENKHLLSKLDSVRVKINSLNENNIDDKNVVKFLTLTKLIKEIKKEL